jgi:hypothetical protein
MATSSALRSATRRAVWLAALGILVVLAGCGAARTTHQAQAVQRPTAFAWLHPGPAPVGWKLARLPSSGATLAYPPGWHAIHTDPGTASVALTDARHKIVGYLNATPRQGAETLANWAGFRTGHIREEGSRQIRTAAAATRLRFRSGRGSCVIDAYRNGVTRYREIACLVKGSRATTVIVGAAPVREWDKQARVIEPAIASFAT